MHRFRARNRSRFDDFRHRSHSPTVSGHYDSFRRKFFEDSPRNQGLGTSYRSGNESESSHFENSRVENFQDHENVNFQSPTYPVTQLFHSPMSFNRTTNPYTTVGVKASEFLQNNFANSNFSTPGLPNMRVIPNSSDVFGTSAASHPPFSNTQSSVKNFSLPNSESAGSRNSFNPENLISSNFTYNPNQSLAFGVNQSSNQDSLRSTVFLPPYQQIVDSNIGTRSNPYSSISQHLQSPVVNPFTSSNSFVMNRSGEPSSFMPSSVLSHFPVMSVPMASSMLDSQKHKEQIFRTRIKEITDETSNVKKCNKKNYTQFRENDAYMPWRSGLLMQAEADYNSHQVYNPSFVPLHEQYPKPSPYDAEFEAVSYTHLTLPTNREV